MDIVNRLAKIVNLLLISAKCRVQSNVGYGILKLCPAYAMIRTDKSYGCSVLNSKFISQQINVIGTRK